MANYDLNEIADALRNLWQAMPALTFGGQADQVTAYSEIEGVANVPAIGIELDDVAWDVTMARGADSFTFLAYLMVSTADSPNGQRLLRTLLSSDGLAASVKDRLEQDRTLGGLVSYAVATRVRSIGSIKFGGLDYLGAVIEVEVVAQ